MAKRKHTPLSGNARYRRLGRDLFWEFYALNDNNEFIKVKWTGYDDAFWWDNVSLTDEARIRIGSDGRRYKITFQTNRVVEVEE